MLVLVLLVLYYYDLINKQQLTTALWAICCVMVGFIVITLIPVTFMALTFM